MKNLSAKTRFLNALRILLRNRIGEALLIPFTNGKKATAFFAKIPANYYQYPKPTIRETERNGFHYTLDISDYMQWVIYFGIQAEPRNKLYSLVKPGMVVFDIGANIGETTMAFSAIAQEVHSFEPDPQTFVRLQKHIEQNHIKNVRLHNYALGAKKSTAAMLRNTSNSGGNRIVQTTESENSIVVNVADELLGSGELPIPDFMKIDVEGFEAEVLQGCSELLNTRRPVIFAEMNNSLLHHNGSSVNMILEFLLKHKYKSVRADSGKTITADDSFDNEHFDIIAIPE